MFLVNPARQRIHMKNQAFFSSKDKSKKLKCRLLQFLFGALRVNVLLCKKTSLTVYIFGQFIFFTPFLQLTVLDILL